MHGRIDERRSDFDLIFEPLYDLWRDFLFIDDGFIEGFGPFMCDEEEDRLRALLNSFNIAIEKVSQFSWPRYYRKATVLKDFGKYVSASEGNGFHLLNPDTSFERALELEDFNAWPNSLESLPTELECLIHNWDGVYWEIYTTNNQYLDILRATHAGSPNLSAYWVELLLDYPNPRGKSPEDVKMKKVDPIDTCD